MCFLRRCEEYFLCHYLPPSGINSVGAHISLEVTLYLDQYNEPSERHLRQLIFNCLLKRETCITGCHSMDDIDLLELGSYTELQGGNIVLPSGYSSILEPVSKDIPQENIVKSHPVSSVRWHYGNELYLSQITSPGGDSGIDLLANGDPGNDSDDSDRTVTDMPSTSNGTKCLGREQELCTDLLLEDSCTDGSCIKSEKFVSACDVSLISLNHKKTENCEMSQSSSCGSPPNVEVTCENGVHYYADHVICTIPLGVLKEKCSTLFCPPLPQYKKDSINRLLFGTVDKILLEYDRPFLNADVSEVMLLWESEVDNDNGESFSFLIVCATVTFTVCV